MLDGLIAQIPEDYDNFTIHLQRVVGCGDTVLVEARYTATVKETGKPLDAQVAHVWDLRDGKAVRWQQYADTWQLADARDLDPTLAPSST